MSNRKKRFIYCAWRKENRFDPRNVTKNIQGQQKDNKKQQYLHLLSVRDKNRSNPRISTGSWSNTPTSSRSTWTHSRRRRGKRHPRPRRLPHKRSSRIFHSPFFSLRGDVSVPENTKYIQTDPVANKNSNNDHNKRYFWRRLTRVLEGGSGKRTLHRLALI